MTISEYVLESANRPGSYVGSLHDATCPLVGPGLAATVPVGCESACDRSIAIYDDHGIKVVRRGRIEVQANPVLGTGSAMATVLEEHDWGYTVRIDGDDPEWSGPVDRDGNVLCEAG